MSFATNFKRLCEEKGMSRTAVVKSLGWSNNKVNRWGNGSLPKPEDLTKLAQFLGCTVMDFFADDDIVAEQQEIKKLTEDEQDIIRLFRMLSRKEKHDFMSKAYEYERTILEQHQL